jgi:hypothetical protein
MAVGLVLFAAGTWLLWYNEGRSVATGDAIAEARGAVVEMPDISKVDAAFSGKLVHATGFADTKETLEDPLFGLKTTAISLRRGVEYYQWVENAKSETRKKLGGGTETVTTYTYNLGWVSKPVDSSRFKDPAYTGRNTVLTTVPAETFQAKNVSFGAYRLPGFAVSSIAGSVPVNVALSAETLAALSKQVGAKEGETLVHSQGGVVYLGADPAMPQIGDVRVSFTEVRPAEISILAQVINDTFEPFRASNGNTFSKVSMGTLGAQNMFGDAETGNKILTWALRGVGVVLVIVAGALFMGPLSVLADVIPFLGSIVGAGTFAVAFLLGLAWSLIIIAAAWLRFRPLIGGSLLGAAAVLIALLWLKGRGRKSSLSKANAE